MSRFAPWLVLLGTLHLPASAQEFPFRMPDAPVDAKAVHDYRSAIDAIVHVMVNRFSMPVPRGRAQLHGTRESFEQGLVQRLRLTRALARSTAEFAKAAVGGHVLLINEPLMADLTWPQRIETLAHEVAHNVQLTLADRPGLARPQWLIEGFAEWLAFNVTSALGLDDLEDARRRMVEKVRAARATQGLPRLLKVDTFAGWVEARKKHGFDATYSLSFLITDFLVQRHSLAAARAFFREFRHSEDSPANFRAAFGEDLDEFERALDSHLEQLLAGNRS